jgi:hypothetical protein
MQQATQLASLQLESPQLLAVHTISQYHLTGASGQYEKQTKELQEAYGEAMLELRVRKKLQSLLGEEEK